MAILSRVSSRLRHIGFTVGLAIAVAAPAADAAHAQGLFDVLRGIFGGGRPPVQRMEPPLLPDRLPEDGVAEVPEAGGGPYVAYCVRMCDGRYFPLPRNAGSPTMTPDKVCSAMCPSAQTKIFSGTNITHAVASDGRNYSSIKNAFLYREKMVDGCSCNAQASVGTASVDIENDPTLRRGDIVVTSEGPKVFTGDSKPPHKPSDFVPAEGYKGLPKSVRQQLGELRVTKDIVAEQASAQPAPAAAAATPAPAPKIIPPSPVGPHASLSYMPVKLGPVDEAFATFRN